MRHSVRHVDLGRRKRQPTAVRLRYRLLVDPAGEERIPAPVRRQRPQHRAFPRRAHAGRERRSIDVVPYPLDVDADRIAPCDGEQRSVAAVRKAELEVGGGGVQRRLPVRAMGQADSAGSSADVAREHRPEQAPPGDEPLPVDRLPEAGRPPTFLGDEMRAERSESAHIEGPPDMDLVVGQRRAARGVQADQLTAGRPRAPCPSLGPSARRRRSPAGPTAARCDGPGSRRCRTFP